MTRRVTVSCTDITGAKLAKPPEHSDISNVSGDYGLRFDARPHRGAPRFDEATFELSGYEGSIQLRVTIEVVPTAENSAPSCEGDRATMRSDGKGPVDLYMHPYCRDPDGDEFVIHGGPPGTHPQSPKDVPAGDSDSNWPYRTATFSGTETATIWAVDSLGARSEDARLEVTVGPAVDRLPECEPSVWGPNGPGGIPYRPGTLRRFALVCTDADADPFEIEVSSPPARGALALFDVAGASHGYWGAERWVDAAYVPAGSSPDHGDSFTVTASGPSGDVLTDFTLVPRPLPENFGAHCGAGSTEIRTSTPGALRMQCYDDESDPINVEVVTGPRHGTTGPAVVTPARYGYDAIAIPYVPNPGYEGYDCVEVVVTDGHGTEIKFAVDIWVKPQPPPPVPEIELPPLPPLPTLPPIQLPGAGPPNTRSVVEQALGTKAVKRIQRAGGAEVWARSKLSRKELARTGQGPALVVVCTARCQVRGLAELTNGSKALRSSRRKTVARVMARQPHVLALAIGGTEKRSLNRARKPRARFKLSVRPDGGQTSSLKRTIPIGN
jgi:hypothetical protein